jgi:hypothetical protein
VRLKLQANQWQIDIEKSAFLTFVEIRIPTPEEKSKQVYSIHHSNASIAVASEKATGRVASWRWAVAEFWAFATWGSGTAVDAGASVSSIGFVGASNPSVGSDVAEDSHVWERLGMTDIM